VMLEGVDRPSLRRSARHQNIRTRFKVGAEHAAAADLSGGPDPRPASPEPDAAAAASAAARRPSPDCAGGRAAAAGTRTAAAPGAGAPRPPRTRFGSLRAPPRPSVPSSAGSGVGCICCVAALRIPAHFQPPHPTPPPHHTPTPLQAAAAFAQPASASGSAAPLVRPRRAPSIPPFTHSVE
jgi:hypothetical protein